MPFKIRLSVLNLNCQTWQEFLDQQHRVDLIETPIMIFVSSVLFAEDIRMHSSSDLTFSSLFFVVHEHESQQLLQTWFMVDPHWLWPAFSHQHMTVCVFVQVIADTVRTPDLGPTKRPWITRLTRSNEYDFVVPVFLWCPKNTKNERILRTAVR